MKKVLLINLIIPFLFLLVFALKVEAQTTNIPNCGNSSTNTEAIITGNSCGSAWYSIKCKALQALSTATHRWTIEGVNNNFVTYIEGNEVCVAVPNSGAYRITHGVWGSNVTCDFTFSGNNVPSIVPVPMAQALRSDVDRQKKIGTIQGANSVSLAGSATYSIPIAIPSGVNGQEPSLSIGYDSNSGTGIMGQGWNFAGLSEITRVGADYYHSGVVVPVEQKIQDHFTLDGNRLALKSGTSGSPGSIYKTENEAFAKITILPSNSSVSGVYGFKVETKDGRILEYGNAYNAAIERRDSRFWSTRLSWKITKASDLFGNYIEYFYRNENGEILLDEIKYSGNANVQPSVLPPNSIKFSYAKKTDINYVYYGRVKIPSNYVINKIDVFAEGVQYSTYKFQYGFDNFHTYLMSAELLGANNDALQTTEFRYGDKPNLISSLETSNTSVNSQGQPYDFFTGDFNGDGKNDIILADFQYVVGSLGNKKVHDKLNVYCSKPDGTDFEKKSTLTFPTSDLTEVLIPKRTPVNFLNQDVNGDNIDDVIRTKHKEITGKTYTLNNNWVKYTAAELEKLEVYQGDNQGVLTENPELGNKFSGITPLYVQGEIETKPKTLINPHGNYLVPGDFDGDGLLDYMTLSSNLDVYSAYLNQPKLDLNNQYLGDRYFATELGTADGLYPIDIDGDGRTEIMRIKGRGVVRVTTGPKSNPTTTTTYPCKIISLSPREDLYNLDFPTSKQILFFGDFNGDRKTDLFLKDSLDWKVYFSNGASFEFSQNFTFQGGSGPDLSNQSEHLRIADFNGDGLSDIVYVRKDYFSQDAKIDVYYSRGASFYLEAHTIPNTSVGTAIEMGDYNGDGKTELLSKTSVTTPLKAYRFYANKTNHLLEKVQDGLNREIAFKYDKATTGTVYTKGTGKEFPLNNIQLPMFLVAEMDQPNGIGGINTTKYQYNDAWLHRQGLGFLGFGKVTTENTVLGTKQESISDILSDAGNFVFYPYLKQSISTIGNVTNTTTNAYELKYRGAGLQFWLRPTSSTSVNGLTGATTVQEFTKYDDTYGDVTDQIVKINTDYETLRTETTYEQRGLISVPTLTTVTKTRKEDSNNFVAKTKRTFGTKGELLSEKVFDGSPNNSITTVFEGYNDFGQPQFKKVTGTTKPGSLETRITEYAYSANGRFVLGTKNPLNQTSGVTMDPKWGKPLTMTPISGIVTTNTYDGFGRLKTSLSLPHTVASTISYQWGLANDPFLYKVVSTSQGSPTSTEYFDKLERSIKKETIDLNGITLVTETTYDARGNVATTTSPHHTTGSYTGYLTTTNTYDALNRVTNVAVLAVVPTTNPPTPAPTPIPPTTIVHSTNGLTVRTTSPGGKWSEQVSDVSGKVVETSDAGGVLKMTYFSHGGQKDVKMQGTAVVLSLMTYDDIGRQITMTEPNSGISSYLYNAFGELIEQQIAGGEQVIFTYNKLGQLATRKNMGLGSTTTYAYYDATTGAAKTNALKSVTGFANHSMLYDYDAYGRMTLQTETIKGTPFTKSFTYYPITSELKNVIFHNGVVQENVYDGNGYMTEVKVAAAATPTTFTSVWKEAKRDGFGNYREYKMGTKTSTMTYDAYGFPINYTTPGVQNLDFKFEEKNGNLKYREDKIKNKKEDFTYDNLERLLTATVVGQTGMTLTYENNGNIKTKTGLGTQYYYESPKIHAVTKVADYPTDLNRGIQNVTYTPFHQANKITEKFKQAGQANWTEIIDIEYGSDYERRYAKYNGNSKHIDYDIYYLGDYEEIKPQYAAQSTKINYIYGGDGLCAMVVDEGAGNQINYVYKDYLGSILTLTDATGAIKCEQSFDAWGRRRNATDWTYVNPIAVTHPYWLYRGYTGHEHYDRLSGIVLINMNARIYDPVNGRMLRWDIALGVSGTQGFNRYTYANNNPLKYTDPTGNWIAHAIGAVMGAYTGWQIGSANGATGLKMAGYIVGGAIIGGVSAGLGSSISSSSMLFANTIGIATSSFVSSAGMKVLSGGQTPMSINFGAASYNFDNDEWGYLGKKGNSVMENVGYTFGGLANLQDVIAGTHGTDVEVLARKHISGHSEIKGGYTENGIQRNIQISVGPDGSALDLKPEANGLKWESQYITRSVKASNQIGMPENSFKTPIHNINGKLLANMTDNLNSSHNLFGFGSFRYGILRGCVNYTSRALLYSGVPTINSILPITSPVFLNFELAVRQYGIYASPYLTNGSFR